MWALLEQKYIASPQFAVKSVHAIQNGISGKELVSSASGNTGNSLKSTLNNFQSTDEDISEEEAERELSEIGNQWLELVREIIDNSIIKPHLTLCASAWKKSPTS